MQEQYVDKRGNGYWVTNSRISLESVILAFLDGLSPETIATECFPTLSLEQVYGTITFYLRNREEIDLYLRQMANEAQAFQQATHDAAFAQKLAKVRLETQLTTP